MEACKPMVGRCPRCGYQNQIGAQRCVRCQAPLLVPAGCTGSCVRCLVAVRNAPQSQKRKD